MLTRAAATKVVAANDDGVLCLHGPLLDEAGGVLIVGQANEGVAAELLVLVRLQRQDGGCQGSNF
jgi:hypothetical protein